MVDDILRGSRREIFQLLAEATEATEAEGVVLSQYAIANMTGYSVRQVQRSLHQLCTTGLITRQPLGPGLPYQYQVNNYE